VCSSDLEGLKIHFVESMDEVLDIALARKLSKKVSPPEFLPLKDSGQTPVYQH
jgi:hypothetical protein